MTDEIEKAGEATPDQVSSVECWGWTAQVVGYNEIAKKCPTLAQKIFCRVARDIANERATALGGGVEFEHDPTILVLKGVIPHVNFKEADIELMRDAVRRHDNEKGTSKMSRRGDEYEVARHDGRGRLIVDVFCPGGADGKPRAADAFRRYFREGAEAPIRLRSLGRDTLDPAVETFEYVMGGEAFG